LNQLIVIKTEGSFFMALDGIVISNIVEELNQTILNGRISKIAQPEFDELLLTIKNNKTQYKLLLSAGASLPLIYLTQESKVNPMTAPNFCMLLRKHLNGGKIISITQPNLERIIHFEIEHLNDMGDLCQKFLTIELMGKHSNIIFRDDNLIIDSIKHVSSQMSSVREVLPGRSYFIPDTQEKFNPLILKEDTFYDKILSKPMPLSQAIYKSLTGISPIIAEEICYETNLDSAVPANTLSEVERVHLYHAFQNFIDKIKKKEYSPIIFYKEREPIEFSSLPLTIYQEFSSKTYSSISQVLETYYASKNTLTRIRQKSSDLRKIVQTALERNRKKYDLQLKQLKDTEKRDDYKLYGELLYTYGYNIKEGAKELEAFNYYDNNTLIKIPLDPDLSAQENAKRYFDKYGKLKRTYEALSEYSKETKEEITHLESIATALDIALLEEDLQEIKEELIEYGYIRRKYTAKKQKITSKPFHYLSSDGFHIYVGKNNFQNEDITFQLATGNDWWFHAKGIPGSHVIVKTQGKDLPDKTFEEAARLAAFYSKGRGNEKVEIDYTEKKNIKKVAGAKPGFVIYHTNYSMLVSPDIQNITLI
jgi:predicted ribosome quality control (RQC) complex YloA/Tae2 family protein